VSRVAINIAHSPTLLVRSKSLVNSCAYGCRIGKFAQAAKIFKDSSTREAEERGQSPFRKGDCPLLVPGNSSSVLFISQLSLQEISHQMPGEFRQSRVVAVSVAQGEAVAGVGEIVPLKRLAVSL